MVQHNAASDVLALIASTKHLRYQCDYFAMAILYIQADCAKLYLNLDSVVKYVVVY